jgi:hypothetical protein
MRHVQASGLTPTKRLMRHAAIGKPIASHSSWMSAADSNQLPVKVIRQKDLFLPISLQLR